VNPPELRYTSEHEWVRLADDGTTVRVGITDFAQESLGDIVYVHIPGVGEHVDAGSAMGELESTKSVSDLFAPVSGTVNTVNDVLDTQPELINSDPYGEGWIVEITLSDDGELAGLLSAEDYEATVTSN
jgi:glycine cleavage system H protein